MLCGSKKFKVLQKLNILQKNKVFLLSLKRFKIETEDITKKVNSICRFEWVTKVKSKNIKQNDHNKKLELLAIDYLKNREIYEINLIFANNAYIALTSEIIEVSLEDQQKID